MLLVFQDKKKPGRINIAWPWVPFFIGDNKVLIEQVKEDLYSQYSNCVVDTALLKRMHHTVIDSISARLPIKGLREYLEAIEDVIPEEGVQ